MATSLALPTALPVSGGRALVYGTNRDVLDFASQRIGLGTDWPDDATAMTLQATDGTIQAVWVFDRFEATDCNLHMAVEGKGRWATRDVMAAVFAFPFWQLGLHRITAPVASRNRETQVLAIKTGFIPECLRRGALPDDDVVQFVMFRDRCPWLRHREMQDGWR